MWLKISLVLLALNFNLIASQNPSLSCNYINRDLTYLCQLSISNPDGIEFDNVPGNHMDGRTNDDVVFVEAFLQNSRNIPSVICRQFPNLQTLYFLQSSVSVINENAFASCANLESLVLIVNSIQEIPANTFRNNARLSLAYFNMNPLTTIHANSFTGTALSFIDLEFCALGRFDPIWFESVNQTLTVLNIMGNDIATLPSGGFLNLRNIEWLDLSTNVFTSLPDDALIGLHSLTHLYTIYCGLSELNPAWFTDLPMLSELHLTMNGISTLPDGIFSPLRRLNNIYLGYNNITEVTSAQFGDALFNLEVISLLNNGIFAIEMRFFDEAENLNALELYGNRCTSTNHFDIVEDPYRARDNLRRCFDNFGPEIIECNFRPNPNHDYSCYMTIRNPLGREFETIAGEHLSERTDDDVIQLTAYYRNTLNVPSVICRQFPQLRELAIVSSYLELINEQSFANCAALEELDISFNIIRNIPDNTFRNSPRLNTVFAQWNHLRQTFDNSFAGTALRVLILNNNELSTYHAPTFNAVGSTLTELNLMNNYLGVMPEDAFANVRNLRELRLGGNFFFNIPGNVFSSLTNLVYLGIGNCGFRELNTQWFQSLGNLETLNIEFNLLTELQENIFNSNPSLSEIFFYGNQIVELRAESFGNSLGSLTLLYGTRNRLNSFDGEILDRATNLQYLLLFDNLCVQENFYDVQTDVANVRQSLGRCTTNYATTPGISCDYRLTIGILYWCTLSLQNPLGRNAFNTIPGNHIGNRGNDHVSYVYAWDANSRVIPSVICEQFRGLRRMDFIRSNVDVLSSDSFRNCNFLDELVLVSNNMTSIPGGTFSGAPNLRILFVSASNLRELTQNSFAGTQLQELDLSHNFINRFDSIVFNQVADTLEILSLTDNQISELPQGSFDRLTRLRRLYLTENFINRMPAEVFAPLVNLETLHLVNCGFQTLNPVWFERLETLRVIEVDSNYIRELPEGVFNLPNLIQIGISGNQIVTLDANSFGRSLQSIEHISADNNRIMTFDPHILENATNLFGMELEGNQCVDASFNDIQANYGNVRLYMNRCIVEFSYPELSCEYWEDEAIYECIMTISNYWNRLRFERIGGNHLDNRNDNFVNYVRATSQNTRTIPSIICQQFPHLEGITFVNSNMEYMTKNTFRGCEYLFSINLYGNRIQEIPDDAFSGNVYLSNVRLGGNRIRTLTPRTFAGTQIYYLDLESNQLTNFDPRWLASVANNMYYLILRNNRIYRPPRNAFSSFPNLFLLELSGNRVDRLLSNTFQGLNRLVYLEMANCALGKLNPRWFWDLEYLTRLEVDLNGIEELPEGVFNMPHLSRVGIAFNQISVLNSTSFGASMGSLTEIAAENNHINAIDRAIIDEMNQLNLLQLAENVCVNVDFINVQDNIEAVRQYLSGCFSNFA